MYSTLYTKTKQSTQIPYSISVYNSMFYPPHVSNLYISISSTNIPSSLCDNLPTTSTLGLDSSIAS